MTDLAAYRARHAAMYQQRLFEEDQVRQEEQRKIEEEKRILELEEARKQEEIKQSINGIRDLLMDIEQTVDIGGITDSIQAYNSNHDALPDTPDIKATALDILQSINNRSLSVDMHQDAHLVTNIKAAVGVLLHKAGVLASEDEEIDLQIDMDCSRDLWMAIQLDNEINARGPMPQPRPRRARAQRKTDEAIPIQPDTAPTIAPEEGTTTAKKRKPRVAKTKKATPTATVTDDA